METRNEHLAQLQELLQDAELRSHIRDARDQDSAIKQVLAAGARQGFKLPEVWVRQAFDDVRLVREPIVLSERELIALSGGGNLAASSENKLCHTESCGGNHAGCC